MSSGPPGRPERGTSSMEKPCPEENRNKVRRCRPASPCLGSGGTWQVPGASSGAPPRVKSGCVSNFVYGRFRGVCPRQPRCEFIHLRMPETPRTQKSRHNPGSTGRARARNVSAAGRGSPPYPPVGMHQLQPPVAIATCVTVRRSAEEPQVPGPRPRLERPQRARAAERRRTARARRAAARIPLRAAASCTSPSNRARPASAPQW
jgi:hypothetical protein